MKKIIIVLLALAVVGAFAFAQDEAAAKPTTTWSATANTGFQIDSSGALTSPIATLWDNDSGDGAAKLAFTAEVKGPEMVGAWSNYGAKAAAVGLINNTATGNQVRVDAVYAYFTPIQYASFWAGKGMGQDYTTPIEGWGSGGTGFQIRSNVYTGVNLWVGYEISTDVDADFKIPEARIKSEVLSQLRLNVGASADIPGIVKVGGGWNVGASYAWAGIEVKALPELIAKFDMQAYTFGQDYAGAFVGNSPKAAVAANPDATPPVAAVAGYGDPGYDIEADLGYIITAASLTPEVVVYYHAYDSKRAMPLDGKLKVKYTGLSFMTPSAYFKYTMTAKVGTADAPEAPMSFGLDIDFPVAANTISFYSNMSMNYGGEKDRQLGNVGVNFKYSF